ncbi:hypothetical protein, partial [Parafrankia sp. BMG5.11]|uniref:hypothetical protein n=1 Tax=Parafrankia sp. BMG5.11 TaxID=222540 RepID=UPI001A9E3A64
TRGICHPEPNRKMNFFPELRFSASLVFMSGMSTVCSFAESLTFAAPVMWRRRNGLLRKG